MKKLRAGIPNPEINAVDFCGWCDGPAVIVEIESDGGPGEACIVIPYDAERTGMGDTWHETLREAKVYAQERFGISLDAWHEVDEE